MATSALKYVSTSKRKMTVWNAESAASADHRITMLLEPGRRIGRRYLNPVPTKVGGLWLTFKGGAAVLSGG